MFLHRLLKLFPVFIFLKFCQKPFFQIKYAYHRLFTKKQQKIIAKLK